MTRRTGNAWSKIALGAAICIAGLLSAFGETLPLNSYTTSDGLAHDRVNRIIRDSRGFMWFCTSEGLSRFDGYQFKNYTQDDGLPHRSVYDVLETRDGALWIGTGDGLVAFDPRGNSARDATESTAPMFRVFRPESATTSAPIAVQDIVEDHSGVFWLGTSNGVYTFEKSSGQFSRFAIPAAEENRNTNFWRLMEDRSGAIWAATELGLYRIVSDRSSAQTIDTKLRAGSMLEDGQGRIWIGSVGGSEEQTGLMQFSIDDGQPRKVRTFRKRDGLHDEAWLNSLLETSGGRLLVAIGSGLSEYAPNADPTKSQFRTLSTEALVELGEDNDGNIWFSTNSSGLRRLSRGGFTRFADSDGLVEKRITSIMSDSDGKLFVLAENTKLHHFNGAAFEAVRPRDMIAQSWGRGRVSFRDHTGSWWIAGGHGLQHYPPVQNFADLATTSPLRTYTPSDGLFSETIFQLLEDKRGDVWIGTIGDHTDSLMRWERATETLHRYTAAEHGLMPRNPVSAFAEDNAGNIWSGHYSGGVTRLRRGKFDVYDVDDGVPTGYVGNIFSDSAGRVWIATSSGGVVRIDDPDAERPSFVNLATRDGLSSNQANCTTEDNFGRIYIATGRGVNRLDLRTGRIKVFTQADGLPENIVTQCRRDKDGALWFGTWSGLARYVPTADESAAPPPVFLADVRVNGQALRNLSQLGETNLENLGFDSDQRQIEIDFFGLAFGVGERLRYQYRLDGIDADWSEPTEQRTINLNLSAGTYSFLVRAINAEGVASETPARMAFTIARPVWQRWWFLLIVAVVVALAAYSIYRYRLAQLLKLERVRTRIATDLHDDIGSSLSQIAILSEVAKHKAGDNGASEPLRRIADTSRDLVDSMSDIVWAINPEKDHLSDLVQRMRRFAGDTFDSTDVGYRFRFDDTTRDVAVGADVRRELYLIFKECVNNTAKHSKADDVDIEVTIGGERIGIRIADNGVGFDVEEAYSGEIKGYGGNGLLNMRRRVERLGGEFEIRSKPGDGTTVEMSVPITATLATAGSQ